MVFLQMNYTLLKKKTVFLQALAEPEHIFSFFENNKHIAGFCFCGRSNAGKSTLLNALLGQHLAYASNTPGKTRQINIFEIKNNSTDWNTFPIYFFDLPGHGYARVSKTQLEKWTLLMDVFFDILPDSVPIIHLQDARHINEKSDQLFFEYNKKKKIILVLNKIDKLKNQKQKAFFNKEQSQLKKNNNIEALFSISAKNKTGLDHLESFIINYLINSNS